MAKASRPNAISVEVAIKLLGTTRDELRFAERCGVIPKPKHDGWLITDLLPGFVNFVRSTECMLSDAAKTIGVSDPWIRKLMADGFVTRTKAGNVEKIAVLMGYIRWLKDEDRRSSKSASASSLKLAREREIEQNMAIKARELIPLQDAIAALDYLVGRVRQEMRTVATRSSRDLTVRQKIEAVVDGALARISEGLAEARDAARSGRDPFAAVEADDAGPVGSLQ